MTSALIESQFLPSLSYFSLVNSYDEIILERCEHFLKQTYRNRCYINTAAGKEMVVVPLTSRHGKSLITDVRVDYNQKWLNRTWRTIQSAYGKAPYFDFYAEDLHAILFQKLDFLYDLNHELLSLCLKWLGWNKPVKETNLFEKEILPPAFDLRNLISDKKEHPENKFYHAVAYPQVFGSKFVPNLSLLDLIYCMGPEAKSIIQRSVSAK